MTIDRLQQIESIYHAALERAAGPERAAYISEACGDGTEIASEVRSLVDAFEGDPEFLDDPALGFGLEILGQQGTEADFCGKRLGQYVISERLGGGGMGDVYLAHDTQLDRPVALKFVASTLLDDPWARRQLAHEAKAVAKLDHPHICTVYDLEEVEGHRFIVMQHVKGEPLSHLIREGRIETGAVLPIARQIVNAVAAAHEHGIIHRDIKPGNIMLTTESAQVKVLDFGLAKIVHSKNRTEAAGENVSRFTREGIFMGTIAYMSPEQLRLEKVDFRSDLFSLGAVLHELVTGCHPFERGSDAETISAILGDAPATASNPGQKIPGRLVRAINRCLEKRKEDRYPSAADLLLELESDGVSDPASRTVRGLQLAPFWVILILVVILSAAASSWVLLFGESTYSVAVLPFANQSADSGLEYVRDGVAETLTRRVADVEGFRAIPYTKLTGYEGVEAADLARIRREVGADLVVSGGVQSRADGLVLRAKLLNAVDGSTVRIAEFPFDAHDIKAAEDELVKRLFPGLEIRTRLAPAGKPRSVGETNNPEAFSLYMQGRHLWKKRDEVYITKAIAAFERAIELDPAYARAHAGLADSYVLMNLLAYGKVRTKDTMAKARASARSALDIDPNSAEAHTSLGVILTRYDWNWAEAEREFRKAIEIDPDYAAAHYWYADLLAVTGRADESVAEAKKARELDPFSPLAEYNVARTLYYARNYDEALSVLGGSEFASGQKIRYLTALALLQIGRYREALTVLEAVAKENKMLAIAALGYTYGKLGRMSEARALIRFLEETPEAQATVAQEIAIIHIGLGEHKKALDLLREVVEDRHGAVVALKVEPLFDPLRGEPGFADLLAKMALN